MAGSTVREKLPVNMPPQVENISCVNNPSSTSLVSLEVF